MISNLKIRYRIRISFLPIFHDFLANDSHYFLQFFQILIIYTHGFQWKPFFLEDFRIDRKYKLRRAFFFLFIHRWFYPLWSNFTQRAANVYSWVIHNFTGTQWSHWITASSQPLWVRPEEKRILYTWVFYHNNLNTTSSSLWQCTWRTLLGQWSII